MCVCVHLWHRAALSISIITGHSQCCQRSHGHLQESTARWFGLRGQQGLQRDNFHLQQKINTQVSFPHIWHGLEWHEAEQMMTEASILGELSFKLYFRHHIPLRWGQRMTAWQRKNDSQCVIEYGLCSFVLVPKGVNSIAQDHLFRDIPQECALMPGVESIHPLPVLFFPKPSRYLAFQIQSPFFLDFSIQLFWPPRGLSTRDELYY